jgi:hypothetical protein
LHALQLLEIRLFIVPPAPGDLGIEDDSAVSLYGLMHFAFELPSCALLLRQRSVRIGATAVRLIR